MELHPETIEDLLSNEAFLAWYWGSDPILAGQWEAWLEQHPQYQPLSELAMNWLKIHSLTEKGLPEEKIIAAHQQLLASLDQAPVITMKRKKLNWAWPAAAAVLVLALTGYFLFRNSNTSKIYDSAYGKISEYKLPDGSGVILNANSRITLNKEWKEGTDREVWLKGEAFFKVKKTTTATRFIVHTGAMDIIVTGTQFNAVGRDDEASVLLTEGSVTIQTCDGKQVKMKPGEFVRIENCKAARQQADEEKVLAWTEARLDFEKTPMNEVAKIINRHYGVKVTLADPALAGKTITGLMPNDSLDMLIRALEETGDFKISRLDHELIISAP